MGLKHNLSNRAKKLSNRAKMNLSRPVKIF
jgi:hypothetical protein